MAAMVFAAGLGFTVWEMTHSLAWLLAAFLAPALVMLCLFVAETTMLKPRVR